MFVLKLDKNKDTISIFGFFSSFCQLGVITMWGFFSQIAYSMPVEKILSS